METRLIGKIISRRFRVEDIIGRGGMAIVYRAFDLKTHQTVAIKVLREEYADDPEYRERFRREGEVCRKLSHPNVVNLIDAGEVGDVSYLAMEYVDGQTLKELINQTGGIAQEDAIRFTLQILAALGHAHQRGIIHRDVKPQNVMVSRAGQIKVGDFGIAGMADTKTLTTDGNVMGSVHYFSPEQAKGMKATAASDLYSVGVILYEMLCGHVPFEGETAVSVAMMHLMEPPKPIEEQTKVSPAVALIVAKSLQKLPQERYQSADAMARDLRRALRHPDGEFMEQHHPAIIEESREVAEKIRKKKKSGGLPARLLTLFVLLVLIALIGVAGIRLYRTMFVTVRTPDLTGLDEATAQRMVSNANLTLELEYAYSEATEGYIFDQNPKANAEVSRGSTVTAMISKGTGLLLVPRLAGMMQADAESVLTAQGLSLGYVEIVPSEKLRGVVLSQSPEAGTNAEPGAAISLTVSGGRIVVPELVGQREEEAVERMTSVGLTCGEISYQNVDTARQDGVVLSQSIEKFTEVLPGSVVNMTVGRYDRRRYTANVTVSVDVPEEGVTVRVTLVDENGQENDMYAAKHTEAGPLELHVTLRSETSGVRTWRLYLDGNFKSEATAVLQ